MIKLVLYIFVIASLLVVNGSAVFAQTPSADQTSFDRYTTPGECAQASNWTENRFWRDKRPDTTYHARSGNPTQRTTIEKIQKCVARFNLSNTAKRDIPGLLQAMLTAEQDVQADAAAAKLVALVATGPSKAKAWTLYQISDIYLGAAQPRISKAEKYLAQLDAMGPAAAAERMLAHYGLARVARLRDSVPLWDRELTAALAASRQMVGDTRKEYALESVKVYLGIADLKGRINDPGAAVQIVGAARIELVPLHPEADRYIGGYDRQYTVYGKAVPLVQATKWFNTNGDNVHPNTGKPALLLFVSAGCGNMCYPNYAVLHRLRDKFEPKGIDIVLMTRTSGYFRNELVKPDSEMVLINNYFTNILQLPLKLAVWQVDFGKRDDGKLLVLSSPNDEAFNYGSAYIIDSKGRIRYVTDVNRDNEAIIEDLLASMVQYTSPK